MKKLQWHHRQSNPHTTTPGLRKSEHQTNICISADLQGLSIFLDSLTLEDRGTTFVWDAGNHETNQTVSDRKTQNLKRQQAELHSLLFQFAVSWGPQLLV